MKLWYAYETWRKENGRWTEKPKGHPVRNFIKKFKEKERIKFELKENEDEPLTPFKDVRMKE